MSAPFNGTKTRVVGFFKGLFGKSADPVEATRDDVTYDYYQSAPPVTGAQLATPAAVAPPATNSLKSHGSAAVPSPSQLTPTPQSAVRVGNGHPGIAAVPMPPAGQTIGHVGGRVMVAKAQAVEARPTTPANPGNAPTPVVRINGNRAAASAASSTVPTSKAAVPVATGDQLSLPLASVVAKLPAELQTRLVKKNFSNYAIPVSRENVLAQLSTGVVKITFGELRLNAPHYFTVAEDADQELISLPLGEILQQINPTQLSKPANQVRIVADDDVTSPFADKGGNDALEVKSDAPTRTITPSEVPTLPSRGGFGEIAKPSAPTANVTSPARIKLPTLPSGNGATKSSAAPVSPNAKIPTPVTPPNEFPPQSDAPIPMPKAHSPAPAANPAIPPAAPRINGAPSLRLAGGSPETPAAPLAPATSMAPPEAAPLKPGNSKSLPVPLQNLIEAWPEALKQEITAQQLNGATAGLPFDSIAAQLKNGRVHFKWAEIRAVLTPPAAAPSDHDAVDLDLPLKVIAPLFLGLNNGTPAAPVQKLKADEAIPNVFTQAAKPATPAAPVAAPAPAPAPVELTPQAIVKRAAALKGVAGALIALPDGLVVASALPAGLNGDKVAAFLPQIFARFDACLKDLTMDRLDNLNFTAGKVPWHVFRSSTVFFAVFGRANEPLPTDWLATLAGELDKK